MTDSNRHKPKEGGTNKDRESAHTKAEDDAVDDFGPRIVEPLEEMPIYGMTPKEAAEAAKSLMKTKKLDQSSEDD